MRTLKKLLVSLLLIVCAVSARAQNLFAYLPDSLSGFDSTQIALLDSFRNYPYYDSAMVVHVNNLFGIQDSGTLSVNLPSSTNLLAKIHRLQLDNLDEPEDGYIWDGFFLGDLEDDDYNLEPDYDGEVHIIKKDSEISGYFRPFNDRTQYSLVSLGNGKNILLRYSNSFENANTLACDNIASSYLATASTSSGPCDPTSILILLDPAAAPFAFMSEINKAMQLLDGATYNTLGADNAYCKFKLAGVRTFNSGEFTFTHNIFNDVDNIAGNSYAQYYRDQYEADLVVCLSNQHYENYPIGGTKFVGAARIGPSDYDAYAIIEMGEMNNRFTFSHEIGHLLGGQHQQSPFYGGDYDNSSGSGHGYGIGKGSKKYNDIMHVKTPSGIREHYYSNPDVTLHKKAFGASPYNDAGHTLKDNGCTVSEFRNDGFHGLDGKLKGTTATSTGYTVALTAEPINGYSMFDFDWWSSVDGGTNWVYLTQNTNMYTGGITFTMPDVQFVIVAMKITDNVGQTKMLYKTIANTHPKWNFPQPQQPSGSKSTSVAIVNDPHPALFVYPSPTNGNANVAVDIPNNLMTNKPHIIVTDLFGKQLADKTVEQAQEIWDFNTDNLPSGTYFVQLRGKGLNETRKLIITK